jgi:excisionase family DNA binding protein
MDTTRHCGPPQTETAPFYAPNASGGVPRLAATPDELAESLGVGRSAIFQAIREGQLTAYKAGNRTTLIEVDEGRRWLRSLPWRGRPPASAAAD